VTFALTLMETFYPNQYANKIISPIPENCKPYDLAVYWRARECEYTSLETFARVLEKLADKPRVMIVRSAQCDARVPGLGGAALRRTESVRQLLRARRARMGRVRLRRHAGAGGPRRG
jgi:hypothetical protein